MFNILTQNGKSTYGLYEFACDTGEDLKKLPVKNAVVGSRALVIETGQVFVLNRNKQWKVMGSERIYGPEEVALLLENKENEFLTGLQDIENQLNQPYSFLQE